MKIKKIRELTQEEIKTRLIALDSLCGWEDFITLKTAEEIKKEDFMRNQWTRLMAVKE